MPTGPKHQRYQEVPGGWVADSAQDCRCMIGYDHGDQAVEESLSVWDAADIWMSHGKDEDYTFGYSVEELERAASGS